MNTDTDTTDTDQNEKQGMPPGLASRVAVSIIVFFGWLVFIIIHMAFFASSYSLYQNIAIVLVAVLIGIAILAVMWASWGIKFGKECSEKSGDCK